MAKKILIVDDDDDIRLGLSVRLKSVGYETVFAADGAGAVAAVRKEKPDLVLLDIGLPAGDGHVVLERLMSNPQFATTPVIVVSAADPRQHEAKALKAGASAYFQKPVEDEELLYAIDQRLGLH